MVNYKYKNAPCKGCPDRKATSEHNCHSDCSKYLEFRREVDEMNERLKDLKSKDNIQRSFKKERVEKYFRRQGRR